MNLIQRISLVLIKAYQVVLSPVLGTRCRFHPTCSTYMAEAIKEHGLFIGGWLGSKRLVRCHPWSDGGHDPVPCHSTHTDLSAPMDAKIEP